MKGSVVWTALAEFRLICFSVHPYTARTNTIILFGRSFHARANRSAIAPQNDNKTDTALQCGPKYIYSPKKWLIQIYFSCVFGCYSGIVCVVVKQTCVVITDKLNSANCKSTEKGMGRHLVSWVAARLPARLYDYCIGIHGNR